MYLVSRKTHGSIPRTISEKGSWCQECLCPQTWRPTATQCSQGWHQVEIKNMIASGLPLAPTSIGRMALGPQKTLLLAVVGTLAPSNVHLCALKAATIAGRPAFCHSQGACTQGGMLAQEG